MTAARRTMRGTPIRSGWAIRLCRLALLLLVATALSAGCRKRSPATDGAGGAATAATAATPTTLPAPPESPTAVAIAVAPDHAPPVQPATKPIGEFPYTLEADTAFLLPAGRTGGAGNDGTLQLDVLEAGTNVRLIEYGLELSVIQTAAGVEGRVPTARLAPRIWQPSDGFGVARLMVGDDPDPEPDGWRGFAIRIRLDLGINVSVKGMELREGALAGFKVAHLTGTTPFTLTPGQRNELRRFVIEQTGTLVIDAADGAEAFADSAQTELVAVFGAEAALQLAKPLPTDHPIYRRPGLEIDRFEWRSSSIKVIGSDFSPRVRGIVLHEGGRVAVFFSREDLSHGLVGTEAPGVVGYAPETARAIMRNVLLYAHER